MMSIVAWLAVGSTKASCTEHEAIGLHGGLALVVHQSEVLVDSSTLVRVVLKESFLLGAFCS